jgi:hypothetical protein
MNRPTHAIQQQQIDDAMAALPSVGWRWLFTPDPRWLNTINTEALRTVNAVRMFIAVTVVWIGIEVAIVWKVLVRCGDRAEALRVACEDSLATGRLMDFGATLFDSYALLLAGMAGIAVAAMGIKRATDTEHRVKIEEAKAGGAPTQVVQAAGGTVVAAAPPSQTTVVESDGGSTVVTSQPIAGLEEPNGKPKVETPKPPTEPDVYADDERG